MYYHYIIRKDQVIVIQHTKKMGNIAVLHIPKENPILANMTTQTIDETACKYWEQKAPYVVQKVRELITGRHTQHCCSVLLAPPACAPPV